MSYEEFQEKVSNILYISDANSVLGWDQQTMMPEKGITARTKQKSALTKVIHQKITSDRLGELIQELGEENLDEKQEAELREVKREHERAVKVPEELEEKLSEQATATQETWRKARENDDFESFAEELEKLVELKKEYANKINPDAEPYRVLFEEYEPYIELERVEKVLRRLGNHLPELLAKIRDSEKEIDPAVLDVELSDDENMDVAELAADTIGFDHDHGRIDLSTHPFTSGNQYDSRITTRFKEDSVSENIAIVLHETGHALYNLGVPKENYGSPLGEPRELSIHESQSRLWENHIGRSKEFWDYFVPKLKDQSGKFSELDPESCYEAVNYVDEDNVIRTEADELSYHLHIILRFELERQLINGDIEVEDLPELWNKKMEQYLGVVPENDAEGVMQDIHWSWGSIGYFPTYSIGSVLSAQIFHKMEEEIDDLDGKISNGEFEVVLDWLRENIHSHGQRYTTDELIEKATGEPLKADYFLEYVESKYSKLYNLE